VFLLWLSDEELLEMIKEADKDSDGLVSEEEFLKIIRMGAAA
jgi:Ca2+-binding EF-hand superfamily protein